MSSLQMKTTPHWILVLATMAPLAAHAVPTVTIDGSSSVYPITEAVAEDFQAAKERKVRVTVGIAGTGGGFKRFCKKEMDISEASRPISVEEMELCKASGVTYVELPIAFDAITVAVSKKNKTLDCITVSELKKMWEPKAQRTVMKWRDVKPGWPDAKLNLYGAGSDSGTFDYFTEAVAGKAKASRGDYTASEDDNVIVTGIGSDSGALGFVPYAYYISHADTLKALKIDGGKGCVAPTLTTAQNGTYSPLGRPLFLYVSTEAAKRPEVQDFVHYYIDHAPALVEEVHYLPLPPESYRQITHRFDSKTPGTVFGGHSAIGASIHDILKREAVQ